MEERKELLKSLTRDLQKTMPNRNYCKRLSMEELKKLAHRIKYDQITYYLWDCELKLKASEIPKRLWFQLILYFILYSEYILDMNISENLEDSQIFDMNDTETREKLNNIKKALRDFEDDLDDVGIVNMCLINFLDYAHSYNYDL